MPIFATDRIFMRTFMRPPSFIVKYSSDLCPNVLLRIRFRFLFSTLFFPRPAPFPTRETRKYGYRCRLLAVGFSPFFAITRRMDLCSEFHLNGNNRGFPNVLRVFKERAQAAFYHFAATPPIFSSFRFLSDLATVLTVPYSLTAFLPPKSARTPAGRANLRQVRKRLLILRFLAAAAI